MTRSAPPTPAGVSAAKLWFKRWKRRLGYYNARRHVWRGLFRRSLRPTDAFLVGHPKSGNTWLAYMLAIALFRDHRHDVTLMNVRKYVPYVHGKDHYIAKYRHLPDPRVFRNEYPNYRDLYPKIIYLMRDPRAVLPSLWHMYRVIFDDSRMTLASFVSQYMAMSGCFTVWNQDLIRWDRQVRQAMMDEAHDPRVVIVKYEDLVHDRRTTLKRLLLFLGVSRAEEVLDHAAERGSFDAMQRLEDQHGAEAYRGRASGHGRFIRVGEIDSWRREVDPALVATVEREFAPVMQQAGYLPE